MGGCSTCFYFTLNFSLVNDKGAKQHIQVLLEMEDIIQIGSFNYIFFPESLRIALSDYYINQLDTEGEIIWIKITST